MKNNLFKNRLVFFFTGKQLLVVFEDTVCSVFEVYYCDLKSIANVVSAINKPKASKCIAVFRDV